MKKQSFTSVLIFIILLSAPCRSFADTIICCQSDTLKLAYYINGSTYINEGCDINYNDVLIIGTSEPVFIYIELDQLYSNFLLFRREKVACATDTIEINDCIFSLDSDGVYETKGNVYYYRTRFEVIRGDQADLDQTTILPQMIDSAYYEIKVRDNFETYHWSNGLDTNAILIDQPGNYTIHATNQCNETFERIFIFDSTSFSEDQFYAGKITGENVIYIDIEPDSACTDYEYNCEFPFDLNNDGIYEFTIKCQYHWWLGGVYNYLGVYPTNGCKIAVDGSDFNAAIIDEGQIINSNYRFSEIPRISLYFYLLLENGDYCSCGKWLNYSPHFLVFSFPVENDTIYGWMKISRGCHIYSYCYFGELPDEINESKKPEISIYPNPFTNQIKIQSLLSSYSVEIFDILGNRVSQMDNLQENSEINLGNLTPGFYFLMLESADNRQIQKIIKQ